MILTCPNCDTRFYVETATFGPSRRKVRCSRCRHVWQQDPLPDDWEPPAPPTADAEPEPPAEPPPPPPPSQTTRAAAAEPAAPPAPKPPMADFTLEAPPPPRITGFDDEDDDLLLKQADRPPLHPPFDAPAAPEQDEDPDAVLARRRERLAQAGMQRPPAEPKKKRSLAWLGWLLLIGLLGALIGGGYEKRAELIAFYPPLAKLYDTLGIPVDAAEWLGLELHNLKSATVLEGGQTRIAVTGEVVNVGSAERGVPAIRVAMRGAGGQELAAYTVSLEKPRIGAEERLPFDVKLPAPTEEVTDLEVAFASAPKS